MLFEIKDNQLVRTKDEKAEVRTSYIRIYGDKKQDFRLTLLNKLDLTFLDRTSKELLKAVNNNSEFVKGDSFIHYLFYSEEVQTLVEEYLDYTYNNPENIEPRIKGEHPIGSVIFMKQGSETTIAYSLLHKKDHWNTRTAVKSTVGKLVSKLSCSVQVKHQWTEAIINAYLNH